MVNNQQPTGFKELLNAMMRRRWFITAMVLGGFMIIILGIFLAIMGKTPMGHLLVHTEKSLTTGSVIPIKIKC